MRGTASDPFAALDSQDVQVRRAAADELAARFPSLDEFSLLHDRGQKFEFGQSPTGSDPALSKRVTEALADDAFAVASITKVESAPTPKSSSNVPSAGVSRTTSVKKSRPYEAQESPRSSNPTLQHPIPQHVGMISTGVQTSPRASPVPPQQKIPEISKTPVWKVPISSHHNRAYSQPRTFEKAQGSPSLKPEFALPARPSLDSRSRSQMSNLSIPKSPASSRPSLESQRPSALDLGFSIDRARSANSNARPSSMHVSSNLDYLRDREMAPGRNFDAPSLQRRTTNTAIDDSEPEPDARNIRSSIDFLRKIEKEDPSSKHGHRRSSSQSKHAKRGSITNIVKGKFGDAFRRFETNHSSKTPEHDRDQPPLTPTHPLIDSRDNNLSLTPIAGSEATGGFSDDDRSAIEETQELSPEIRRELEKRKLEEEERRVEAAAAEYRQRLAAQGSGAAKAGPSKASTIQNRVKNLLDESNKQPPSSRTAEGYGKYTDTGKPLPLRPQDQSGARQVPPAIARKPVNVGVGSGSGIGAATLPQQDLAYAKPLPSTRTNMPPPPLSSSSAPPAIATRNPSGPPPRAPKPKALQTGGSGMSVSGSPVKASPVVREKPLPLGGTGGGAGGADQDWDVETFSKRYPSLSGLEMVETEIPRGRTRDV
jgi:AP2-associated kinase